MDAAQSPPLAADGRLLSYCLAMSRYRAPRPPSSPYITRQGYLDLQQELKHLWKVTRPELTRRVAAAAAQGDRSENADYIYGKRALHDVDRRIQYLSKRLDVLQVIERSPSDRDKVYFGARVTLSTPGQEQTQYRIVGADELDAAPNHISVDSPLARALIGKQCGEQVHLQPTDSASAGALQANINPRNSTYVIEKIEYT